MQSYKVQTKAHTFFTFLKKVAIFFSLCWIKKKKKNGGYLSLAPSQVKYIFLIKDFLSILATTFPFNQTLGQTNQQKATKRNTKYLLKKLNFLTINYPNHKLTYEKLIQTAIFSLPNLIFPINRLISISFKTKTFLVTPSFDD